MQKLNFITLIILCLSTSINSQENETFTQEEIIYGRKSGMALTMVILKPNNPNGKGIISVVSGSWYSGHNQIERWALDSSKPFIDNGYTVFLTMHSSNPRYDISDAVSDMKRAVQYVRYNAKNLNIDPNKIGITGASSGGHLSLVVGTSDDIINSKSEDPVERVSSKVQAVAVFYPPTDFLNWGQPNAYMNYLEHGNLLGPSLGAFKFNEFNETKYIYDFNYSMQLLAGIIKKKGDIEYLINPAFWPALMIEKA